MFLPKRAEERKAGNVNAIGLMTGYGNGSMQMQRKVLQKAMKLLGNEKVGVIAPPGVAT